MSTPLETLHIGNPASKDDVGVEASPVAAKSDHEPDTTKFLGYESREVFLATFTVEDQRKLMRKVDWRIVSIIGVMSMVRQVRNNQ